MSVADILRQIGKPTQASKLVKKIADELRISERQAYRDIKKAAKYKEIRKVTLPDRSVLCLLPEWTLPTKQPKRTLNFEDAFKYYCLKRLDEIGRLSILKPVNAFLELRNVIAMFPPTQRIKLEPVFKTTYKTVAEIQKKMLSPNISPSDMQSKIRAIVKYLIGEVSKVLHET